MQDDPTAPVRKFQTPVDGELVIGLRPGTRVGRYELMHVLGHGGFGITYQARDRQLNRDVAIKEYLPTPFAGRQGDQVVPHATNLVDDFVWGRDRFLEEAKTLARLTDAAGIVNVFDLVEANGTAYMVMELVAGDTLEMVLSRQRFLPQQAIETVLAPLLDGLERVHATGFLHRDIKPANILVDAQGKATLIDFGASRQALGDRTRVMTAVYTPGYAAVEQMTSAQQGPWTDIYALAGTLYHCVAGEPPVGAMDRMMHDRCVPAMQRGAGRYDPKFLAAVDRGLRLKPADRPQTVAEWRQTFARASSHDRPKPVWRRAWIGAAAGGLALAGVAAAIVLPLGPRPREPDTAQPTVEQERLAQEKRESEAKAAAEQERRAKEKREADARAAAEQERLAKEKREADTRAAEQERLAKEKRAADAKAAAEQERLAKAAAEKPPSLSESEKGLVRRSLVNAGYDPSYGSYQSDQGLRDAIRRFQAARGFDATGTVNADQLAILISISGGPTPVEVAADLFRKQVLPQLKAVGVQDVELGVQQAFLDVAARGGIATASLRPASDGSLERLMALSSMRQSIADYQKRNGLLVTGFLTRTTLDQWVASTVPLKKQPVLDYLAINNVQWFSSWAAVEFIENNDRMCGLLSFAVNVEGPLDGDWAPAIVFWTEAQPGPGKAGSYWAALMSASAQYKIVSVAFDGGDPTTIDERKTDRKGNKELYNGSVINMNKWAWASTAELALEGRFGPLWLDFSGIGFQRAAQQFVTCTGGHVRPPQ